MKKNNTKKKSGMSGGKIVAIGTGVAAAGAGAYYLLGPKAKAHQKKASMLMAKMKKEVVSEVKKAKKISAPLYYKAIDIIAENYSKEYKIHEKEINAFAKKLKSDLKDVANKAVKKTVRTLKKKIK
jgi:hypothetical protein